jgi:hypothetical protein
VSGPWCSQLLAIQAVDVDVETTRERTVTYDALPHSVVGGVNSLQASLVLLAAGEESLLRVPFRKGKLPLEALTQVEVAMPLCFDL